MLDERQVRCAPINGSPQLNTESVVRSNSWLPTRLAQVGKSGAARTALWGPVMHTLGALDQPGVVLEFPVWGEGQPVRIHLRGGCGQGGEYRSGQCGHDILSRLAVSRVWQSVGRCAARGHYRAEREDKDVVLHLLYHRHPAGRAPRAHHRCHRRPDAAHDDAGRARPHGLVAGPRKCGSGGVCDGPSGRGRASADSADCTCVVRRGGPCFHGAVVRRIYRVHHDVLADPFAPAVGRRAGIRPAPRPAWRRARTRRSSPPRCRSRWPARECRRGRT